MSYNDIDRSSIYLVDNSCKRCGGLGRYTYGSTSTWRGGIGGQAMTVGPCDRCWGSGEQDRPWPSWREREERDRRMVKSIAARRLFIPPLKSELTLSSPWTFTVYNEYRNASLIEHAALVMPPMTPEFVAEWEAKFGKQTDTHQMEWHWRNSGPMGTFTFPAGTVLIVDRIYIRNGGEDFDSVTFRARDYTSNVRTGLKGSKKEKTLRFWVKLADANCIEFKED